MLLKKSMGMIVDRGPGDLSQSLEKFRDVFGLPSEELDEIQPCVKAETFSHGLTSTSSSR
jgi:hypothetical protein